MQNLKNGLLFCEDTVEYTSCADAPEDLKLTALLPDGTADFFRVRPTKEGFLKRREFFSRALFNPEASLERFTALRDALMLADEAKRALEVAVCENARNYIFAEFATRMDNFLALASQPAELGELYGRLSAYASETRESASFKAMRDRLADMITAKERIGEIDLNVDGDRVKVSVDKAITMRHKVALCLEEYDIAAVPSITRALPIQKGIVDALSKLYPAESEGFAAFYRDFSTAFDNDVFECIPQLSLVIGIIDLVRRANAAGVPYCFPELSECRQIKLYDVYDVALLLKEGVKIVPNDASFTADEPFFYLTGANGGGKTTYLRALGNAMLMFGFGAPVFCKGGEACLIDAVLTHFPKDERFEGSGRFADEQKRVDEILSFCCNGDRRGNSLVLLNETYSTTNEDKATACTSELASRLHSSGNFGLYITHQHSVDEAVVPFLGVVVDEQDKNRRTYRIEKRRLKNRSFAADILAKYGITEAGLRETVLGRD